MNVDIINSLTDLPEGEWQPVADLQHRGKAARVTEVYSERTLHVILPCGHLNIIPAIEMTDFDSNELSKNEEIFCKFPGEPCWRGELREGILIPAVS